MIPQDQNSEEWKLWRKNKIGASDAPSIMNCGFSTPYQLWARKVGLMADVEENDAMKRGKELEPVARNLFNKTHNFDMQPMVIVNPDLHWHVSSLDGYCSESNIFIEIKSPGISDHVCALDKKIPDKYTWQMMHQFEDTKALKAYYVSYNAKHKMPFVALEVLRGHFLEKEYQKLLKCEIEFYRCMNDFEPPELCDNDYHINDSYELKLILNSLRLADKQEKIITEEKKRLRLQAIGICKGHSTICDSVKIKKIPRKGNVDYGNIPELKNIDLNQYRKPPTESWRFSFENE